MTATSHINVCSILAAAALTAGGLVSAASADVVTEWNEIMLQSVKSAAIPPPKTSRAYAMVQGAVYDAVNSISRTHYQYKFMEAPALGASKEAAAAAAAHKVLVGLFPTQQATLDTKLNDTLNALGGSAQSKLDGRNLGVSIGTQMLTLRSNDQSGAPQTYTPKSGAGFWRPVDGVTPAVLPQWGNVTPFTMNSATQFRGTAMPPSLSSQTYADALNEVKDIGALNSATRTADQTNIAKFWADGGGTVTPPGHWNRIGQTVGTQLGNSVEQNARMFALMNLGMADAAINCWNIKYETEFWRPIMAIREADTDGNNATTQDAAWTPLLGTPNFPSFTSGHSTFSAAAATILGGLFGDNVAFTSSTEFAGVPDRSFTSFSQAANEAALSRLYGGIHYSFDNLEGLNCGNAIGGYVSDNFLLTIPTPGALSVLGLGLAAGLRRRR